MKLIKSLILSLAVLVGFSSTSNARDVTLSMWTHNQLYVDYFNTYLEEVQAAFPDDNITFDFQVTPDMATNSLTAIASGSEHTDLLGIEISGFGLFMVDDIISDNFVPLTDMYGDMSQWNPGKVAAWTHTNGEIYGIESEGCYMVYYYNPSILESYGKSVPKTWDEFMETGKILAKDGISMMLSELRFIGMYQQAGGKFFNEDGEFEMNEDLFMEVLKYQEEAFATGVINYTTDYWGQTPGVLYNSKQTVGTMAPDWYNNCCLQPTVKDTQSGEWRVAPLPTWGDEGYIKIERSDSTSDPGTCGIAMQPSYPVVSKNKMYEVNLKKSSCGDCGLSYQACCFAYGADGYPCDCHLEEGGTGQVGADCGDCGVEYGACCIGFRKEGDPCNCDIN